MLLTNCMDPSKLTSVERRQKGTSERLKVPCPAIIKEYNSRMNGVNIHDQLKTSYELIANQGSGLIYEFSSTSWIHVIYKKKVNAKMSLLNFKIILAESLINRFSSRKRKITAEKPQLTVEVPQPLKEPDHIVQFTEKSQRCQHFFTNGKNDVKCFTCRKSCNISLCVQKDRNCFKLYHSF